METGSGSGYPCGTLCGSKRYDFAAVNPIAYEGRIPVFINTEYCIQNMDSVALEKEFKLYPEMKLMVVAYLYGTPGKVDGVREVCAPGHSAVINGDAAEPLGAS